MTTNSNLFTFGQTIFSKSSDPKPCSSSSRRLQTSILSAHGNDFKTRLYTVSEQIRIYS